jgi:hypothetical protein
MELCTEIKMARLADSYALLKNLPRNFEVKLLLNIIKDD